MTRHDLSGYNPRHVTGEGVPLGEGTRLGPYEIVGQLGAGGMGEVYRARDTRLDRTVAIKVLPASWAESPDRRARFDREARAISALNHPRICTLHDIGQQDGVDYLVMEYLEGESLAGRLERGALPLEETLRYGAEIAGALAAAHRAGIVHRDLKPANVVLTRGGVKLLDFGLAKLRAAPAEDPLSMPTMDHAVTGEGTLVGTLPYMAPEQLEGREADTRSDVWALGALLYEMATGTRAFQGNSHASLIGAILKDTPPPISAAQPLTPPALEHLVKGCLAKDPEERWQSARDVERELRWIAESGGVAAAAVGRRQPSLRWALVLAAVLMAGAALGWFLGRRTRAVAGSRPAGPPQRLSIVLPEQAPLAPPFATPFNYLRPSLALAPDESKIVYVSRRSDGRTQLFLRRADSYDPAPIPGTEDGFDPFFSPDGEWVGFFRFDALLKVSLKGGAPLTLTSVVNPVGGAWCDDGNIYFSADEGDELWQLPGGEAGDSPKQVPLTSALAAYPQCLPGGAGLLLTMEPPTAQRSLDRISLPLSADYAAVGLLPLPSGDGSPRLLAARGYAAQYAPSGHLVFSRGGSLVAVPFDLRQLRVTGPELTVLEQVRMNSVAVPAAQFTIGAGGSLLYVRGGDYSRTQLVWADRGGRVTPTAAAPSLFGTIQVSPEGRRAVVEVGGLRDDIYVYDLQDGRRIRVTSDENDGKRAVWHADRRRVVFYSPHADRVLIKLVESDAPPEALPVGAWISSWSKRDVLAGAREGRIWIGTLEKQTTITSTGRGRAWGAVLSPDAGFVAYTSTRTGTFQVFVQPNPPTGQEWQVSSDFGEEPVWSRNSRELFFRRHNQWWSVPFADGAPGPPRLLFEGPFFNAFGPSYDVAPDGRFLMALPPAAADSSRELLWIPHWGEELRAKLVGGQ